MASFGYWNSRRMRVQRERPERGAALYFWILREHFWQMAVLNLYVLLFSLPIVTIAPALCAMNRTLYRMIDDEPQLLWQEFFGAFRSNWKQAMQAVLVLVPLQALLIVVGVFWWRSTHSGWGLLVVWGLQILLVMVGAYVLAMIPYLELSIVQCFKNALLFQLIDARRNLLTVVLLLALLLLTAALTPLSTPFVLALFVPLFGYALAYCTYRGICQFAASP